MIHGTIGRTSDINNIINKTKTEFFLSLGMKWSSRFIQKAFRMSTDKTGKNLPIHIITEMSTEIRKH